MTEFDKQLIRKANEISRWDYREVDTLVDIADTQECRDALISIRWGLYDLVQETL